MKTTLIDIIFAPVLALACVMFLIRGALDRAEKHPLRQITK